MRLNNRNHLEMGEFVRLNKIQARLSKTNWVSRSVIGQYMLASRAVVKMKLRWIFVLVDGFLITQRSKLLSMCFSRFLKMKWS